MSVKQSEEVVIELPDERHRKYRIGPDQQEDMIRAWLAGGKTDWVRSNQRNWRRIEGLAKNRWHVPSGVVNRVLKARSYGR